MKSETVTPIDKTLDDNRKLELSFEEEIINHLRQCGPSYATEISRNTGIKKRKVADLCKRSDMIEGEKRNGYSKRAKEWRLK